MALAAGVSFVSVAKPFVEPLKKALDLLTGSSELKLEIGLCTSYAKPETGYFFVMRAARGAIEPANVRVAEDFRLVDIANQALGGYPYLVFSIEISERRDDWFLIPEIASVYNELQRAVRNGRRSEVDEIFPSFKRLVLTSPDLLGRDAQRLVKEVQNELTLAMPTSRTATSVREIPPLRSIRLFGK